jgi:hypothetical protein
VWWLKDWSTTLEFMNHAIEPLFEILNKMDKDYFLNAHGPIVLIISHGCMKIFLKSLAMEHHLSFHVGLFLRCYEQLAFVIAFEMFFHLFTTISNWS